VRIASVQSRWSHQIRSPPRTAASAAPVDDSTPLTKKNQSLVRSPAISPSTPSIDCTNPPPKRVVISASRSRKRITVSEADGSATVASSIGTSP
jgi:hypothetical protein